MDGPVLLLTDTMDPAYATPMPSIERVTDGLTGGPDTYRICGLTGTTVQIKGLRRKVGD